MMILGQHVLDDAERIGGLCLIVANLELFLKEPNRRGDVVFVALIINFIRTPPTFIRTCADECGNPIP